MRAVAMLLSSICSFAVVASEFDAPWDDAGTALVIDPYHANPIDWEALAGEPRVVAVIHKSTIGTSKIDPAYVERRAEARRRGYLWGSYHWGVAGDPEKQADFYIDTVQPAADELIALDLEDARSKKLMNVDEAIRFIERVKERTGRYPVLYTNHASAQLISDKYRGRVFEQTPLWYARFRRQVTDFPRGVWPTYALWQFSSEITKPPPMRLPGTKADLDINVFNGSVAELRAAWPLTRTDTAAAQAVLEARIRELDLAHARAILTGDATALNALMADDVTVNHPTNRIVHEKQELLDLIDQGVIRYTAFERRPEQFLFYQGLVVVMGDETVVPAPGAPNAGQRLRRRYTNGWMLRGGEWRLAFRHANNVGQAPAP